MGAKKSKCDGVYLPDSPTSLKNFKHCAQTPKPLTVVTDLCTTVNTLDPRSPNANRTPILQPQFENVENKPKQTMHAMLRKRFLSTLHFNLYDPRSPTMQLNRTPIVFEDGTERTFSLDDTFADLLVETHVSVEEELASPTQSYAKDNSMSFASIESEAAGSQEHTPIAGIMQQPLDPRSPTIGVERTPLVFTEPDDEEKLEDEMLEDVLAKLSLDLSSAAEHSLVSLAAVEKSDKVEQPLTNKHLQRLRVPKKPARLRTQAAQIYKDAENLSPINNSKCNMQDEDLIIGKRTPLSCLGNHVSQVKKFEKKNKHTLSTLNAKSDKSMDIMDDLLMET